MTLPDLILAGHDLRAIARAKGRTLHWCVGYAVGLTGSYSHADVLPIAPVAQSVDIQEYTHGKHHGQQERARRDAGKVAGAKP